MDFLVDLWLPVVLSGVFMWIAGAIIHMAINWHKGEWSGLPEEGKALEALRGVGPGNYMFPWYEMKELDTPEMQEKLKQGPCGNVTIWGAQPNMMKNLLYMIIFCLVIGVFVAYIAWHSVDAGAEYLHVFRITGTATFMAWGLGGIPRHIWFGGSPREFWTYTLDSLIYALIAAGTFGWLWPA